MGGPPFRKLSGRNRGFCREGCLFDSTYSSFSGVLLLFCLILSSFSQILQSSAGYAEDFPGKFFPLLLLFLFFGAFRSPFSPFIFFCFFFCSTLSGGARRCPPLFRKRKRRKKDGKADSKKKKAEKKEERRGKGGGKAGVLGSLFRLGSPRGRARREPGPRRLGLPGFRLQDFQAFPDFQAFTLPARPRTS